MQVVTKRSTTMLAHAEKIFLARPWVCARVSTALDPYVPVFSCFRCCSTKASARTHGKFHWYCYKRKFHQSFIKNCHQNPNLRVFWSLISPSFMLSSTSNRENFKEKRTNLASRARYRLFLVVHATLLSTQSVTHFAWVCALCSSAKIKLPKSDR